MKKRALISTFDKVTLTEFARFLEAQDYEIISTGGTFRYLKDQGLSPIEVAEVTQFSEILDGRVKTLHPHIHGGILAKRSQVKHMQTLEAHRISQIDLVVVNLYPFFEQYGQCLTLEAQLELIDIGGITLLRAAAKNFPDVIVITDTADYEIFKKEITHQGEISLALRRKWAGKAFNLTAAYDAAISQWIIAEHFPPYFNISYQKQMDLRYGENPHQKAAYYVNTTGGGAFRDFDQLQVNKLSFNNLRDMDAAWKMVNEFSDPACCAVKHTTPCGVALGRDIADAWEKAYACDPVSVFGGIIAVNSTLTKKAAESMGKFFLEIILAPAYESEALDVLRKKKNLRLIHIKDRICDIFEYVKIDGGLLVQQCDDRFSIDHQVVTKKQPTVEQLQSLIFAQKVVKHVKSNAVVVAQGVQTLGIAGGQTNRIWAAHQAIERALEKSRKNLVLASDAFFPFRDVVEKVAQHRIEAIIQPGGSMRDAESIRACDEYGMAMVFTGMRHFKH
ncbi:MAG: bifunctional phosphoribosylaminoimidazolecarboxamide formyltransferase/IMP cyclohydrolase [Flavobacteriales bacterium AspAUS03]